MNDKEYIESGILESYALGLCSVEEAREVEALCAKHPELQAELERIQQALNSYASMYSKKPNASVKQNIFAAIDTFEDTGSGKGKVVSLQPAPSYRLAIAASLALCALSILANIILYQKYQSVNDKVIALNAEKSQLADAIRASDIKMQSMHQDMAILTDPMVKKVMMKGMAKSPESMAMVYWNSMSKDVFIEIKNMPMPEAGKQYQLWAIVDGNPVDAGMITMTEGDSSLHKMKAFDTAQAFAITLEKEGGSPTPTLEEMYVMGTVSL
jgi:anti-sigma-K factor RskA